MKNIAPRVSTPLFFAHVRDASPGMAIQQTNCHPFSEDRLMFMHNGVVGSFDEVLRPLRNQLSDEVYLSIDGTTDSEHLFALARDELGPRARNPAADDLAEAVRGAIDRVEALKSKKGIETKTTANLALTDGTSLVATRFANEHADKPATLYVSRAGGFTTTDDGTTRAVDPAERGAVLVSSEPMMDQEVGLDPVPPNHMLIVEPDCTYRIEPIAG
jgi:predicted glutamine amidotransferase